MINVNTNNMIPKQIELISTSYQITNELYHDLQGEIFFTPKDVITNLSKHNKTCAKNRKKRKKKRK